MKTILAIFLTVLLLLPVPAFGEIQTVTHSVKQSFGGSQSPDDARISAIAKAKREALEKAGTYIESLTIVKNSQVEKDEILALTAGVLKAEVVSQKNFASDDAFGIEIVVNVIVDTSVLEERVKKQMQDRIHLIQLIDIQKREKQLLQKVVQLEEENRKLLANKQSTNKLKKEFKKVSDGLTAVDWYNKADVLWNGGKLTDPRGSIEYLSNTIKLEPTYFSAHIMRGISYKILGQHQRAIKDYDNAIRILGQYQRAIKDYNAISLKAYFAYAYINRGNAYSALGQKQRAIEDYNKAIRLQLDDAKYYFNRGCAYDDMEQYHKAIRDYDEAISLTLDLDVLYAAYNNRGNAYSALGQYQQAIESCNEAIPVETGRCVGILQSRESLHLFQQ